MEQIVVKSEVQPNGEILLYTLYVDDNGEENCGNQVLELQENADYQIIEANGSAENVEYVEQAVIPSSNQEVEDNWLEEDVTRLLVFYIDNKDSFMNGTTKKEHLWTVACKTMLIGKNAHTCELKLRNLKKKYAEMRLVQQNGVNITWPRFELCHQAFHDDSYVKLLLNEQTQQAQTIVKLPIQPKIEENTGVVVVKNVNTNKAGSDDKVEAMLNLYLRYKKNFHKETNRKSLWEAIAMELGEENSDYWHKRFLNFKQHYLRMLAKRASDGIASISWPYMDLFDRIFEDDPVFQKKYAMQPENGVAENLLVDMNEWNDAECIILAKSYFDGFDEFQDPTIPDNFLWTELARLIDKKPEQCLAKFEELKSAHIDNFLNGGYDLRTRNAIAIVFDNIISKEVDIEFNKDAIKTQNVWTTDEIDELVKFFYENIEMFKDPVCFNVCWAGISKKLQKSIACCKKQWEDLKKLYKSILDDKMENPDLQIDWRYIELFDRIFDYGMDTNLLNNVGQPKDKFGPKIGAKKVTINLDNEPYENGTDEEEYDDKGTKRTKRGVGDSKAFKILEYYQKNKEKFSTTQRKKQVLWEVLAKQIGISGEQCAHRFRNLKQVYMAYVQREINKPEMPILWPYYALCKKVFGYRAIKSKLKNNKVDSDEAGEWTAKEIKLIINYFGSHFKEFCNSEDSSQWTELAQELNKSDSAVYEKFNDLRKSYKRLKAMKEQNPECKVSWKYYGLFDEIYARSTVELENEDVEMEYETIYEEVPGDEKTESQDEEDYQCIIVMPEGQELSDMSNTQIILQEASENLNDDLMEAVVNTKPTVTKWTKRIKKKLLILYLNYLRSRKGKEIISLDMWQEIASKLPEKTALSCRKMFAKLKANHMKLKDVDDPNQKKTPYYTLLAKILSIRPKFAKTAKKELKDRKPYRDVVLPADKVELALQYYLQHAEDFVNPKFEKKYLWTELANAVSEPVNKLFNKINYLKHNYNVETNEVAGEITSFGELLKEIMDKEYAVKATMDTEPLVLEENDEVIWSDEETEQLLVWYLANLEKFKNPKFVRKYLWIEASSILQKSPLNCSKKMAEIRTQYKSMIKENPEELNNWRFYELCQKIYGTGKKSDTINNLISLAQIIEEHNV